jgi:hypothetical protein
VGKVVTIGETAGLVLALPSHPGVFADRRRTKPFAAILEKSGLAWSEKFGLT